MKPPTPIKKAVPRSGWVTTNINGIVKATRGLNRNVILFTSPAEIL